MGSSFNKFWHLNGKKVITIGLVSFVVPMALLVFAAGHASVSMQALLISTLLSLLMMLAFSINGVLFFAGAYRFIQDGTAKSIMPLFDSHYVVDLQNEESKLTFTTPLLRGSISGFPVAVYFPRYARGKSPELVFNFYPLLQSDGLQTKRRIGFELGMMHRLATDIKPEVISFVAALKTEGYKRVEAES